VHAGENSSDDEEHTGLYKQTWHLKVFIVPAEEHQSVMLILDLGMSSS
jgi:hypothetical protein